MRVIFALIGLVAASCAFNLPGIPSAFTDNDDVLSAVSDDIARKFADEYVFYMKTGHESATLRQISMQLASSHSKKNIFSKSVADLGAADQFFMCTTCRAVVNVVGNSFLAEDGEINGPDKDEVAKRVMLEICSRLNVATPEVCTGLYELNWPIVDYVIQNTSADSRSVCGILPINFCRVKQEEYNWSVKIDASGAAITGPKKDIPQKSADDLKVVHLTDIHYDPDYKVGSLAACDEPMCCQRTGTVEAAKQAGYWSDYRDCDTPKHTIEDALDHIKQTHTHIDYIYQTGDIVSHLLWATSKDYNTGVLTAVNDLIKEKFGDIPVYSCVGNHDSHPTNMFAGPTAPQSFSSTWLYEHLWTVWSKWLPASTKDTILKSGYYTVTPKDGFRIISLNSNDCYLFNWWVFQDGRMGIEQLEWLHDTLLAAEKANEYVHILTHFPSGTADCWTVWAREFNLIIERFHHIIGGIFTGHTHTDEINVHYSTNGHAVAVSWNGGSLTSYTYKNPNYVVYDVEPKSMQVVDYETWIFNLTEANEHGNQRSPLWQREYQFSTEFTDNLSPGSIDELLETMAENPALLHKYWRYKFTTADPRLSDGCNNKCLRSTICHLATTVYDQKTRCNALKEKLNQYLDEETTTSPSTTTNVPETTTKDPGDDGASAIAALQLTTLLGLLCVLRMIF